MSPYIMWIYIFKYQVYLNRNRSTFLDVSIEILPYIRYVPIYYVDLYLHISGLSQ